MVYRAEEESEYNLESGVFKSLYAVRELSCRYHYRVAYSSKDSADYADYIVSLAAAVYKEYSGDNNGEAHYFSE